MEVGAYPTVGLPIYSIYVWLKPRRICIRVATNFFRLFAYLGRASTFVAVLENAEA